MTDELYLYSQKCRLCLRNEKILIPIFGDIAQDMQIFLKIRTCLPIQITQNDSFPQKICHKCIVSLDQSYNFWKLSRESEAVLKDLASVEHRSELSTNLQQQRFECKPMPSRGSPSNAKNRKLVLPTGMSLIIESDSEDEPASARVAAPTKLVAVPSKGQVSVNWFNSEGADQNESVTMDTTPDFLDSLSQTEPGIRCKTRTQNFAREGPDLGQEAKMDITTEFLRTSTNPAPTATARDATPTLSKEEQRSVSSTSLFQKSAEAWRSLYRSGELTTFHHDQRATGISPKITEVGPSSLDMPSTSAGSSVTMDPPARGKSYEELRLALSECGSRVVSHREPTSPLLYFLRNQDPWLQDKEHK
ncbi:uncharacterized protein [Periplaneta americana]|uniref:uncharacterized protein n=1 Tax=Periplaneta americana TaxID=6978 RepID=UPI0037E96399